MKSRFDTRQPRSALRGESRAMRIVTIPKSKIVDAAIKLFSDYGFYGVTYMKLAKEANTTAPSVFRQFKSKPKLFEAALETAVSQSPDAAQFLYMIHEGRRKQALPAKKAIAAAILNWYSSVSPQTARLMCQAYLSKNKKWEEKAFSALYMIIDVLASSVEAESPKTAK